MYQQLGVLASAGQNSLGRESRYWYCPNTPCIWHLPPSVHCSGFWVLPIHSVSASNPFCATREPGTPATLLPRERGRQCYYGDVLLSSLHPPQVPALWLFRLQPVKLRGIFRSSAHISVNTKYLCVSTAQKWLPTAREACRRSGDVVCAACGSWHH